jgi:hypothetical protein
MAGGPRRRQERVLRTGHYFQYDAPEGWTEAVKDGRYVYRGAKNEELTISTTIDDVQGMSLTRSSAGERRLQAALRVAKEGMKRAGLKVFKPLFRDEGASDLPCWTVLARTLDGAILFGTAILQASGGLMLVTFEAPFGPEATSVLGTFLKSVREPTH